MNSQLCTAA
jgi:hypothetical protein